MCIAQVKELKLTHPTHPPEVPRSLAFLSRGNPIQISFSFFFLKIILFRYLFQMFAYLHFHSVISEGDFCMSVNILHTFHFYFIVWVHHNSVNQPPIEECLDCINF